MKRDAVVKVFDGPHQHSRQIICETSKRRHKTGCFYTRKWVLAIPLEGATVYGLSTEGYKIASTLALEGIPTTIIDENLQMGLQLKAETVKSYPTIEHLTEEEALLGLQPIESAISSAEFVFFTPKIRRKGEDLKVELSTRTKEVAKHLSRGSTLIYNLPTSLGGNSDNLELLKRVSGLKPDEDFFYIYAPLDPITHAPTVLGVKKSKPEKKVIETLNVACMDTSNITNLSSAELIHLKHILERYSDFAVALESYRKIKDREIRFRFNRLPGYREVYFNELVEGLVDLKLFAMTLSTGEPLLHVATGLIRSVEGYVRYLVEEIRDMMKSRDLKASKTKVVLVWSVDRFEMRGDCLQNLENLADKLGDYVGGILNLNMKEHLAQRNGWQDIFLGGKTSLIIVCSSHDFKAASDRLTSSHRGAEIALMKANLLCEVIQ